MNDECADVWKERKSDDDVDDREVRLMMVERKSDRIAGDE